MKSTFPELADGDSFVNGKFADSEEARCSKPTCKQLKWQQSNLSSSAQNPLQHDRQGDRSVELVDSNDLEDPTSG